MSKKKIEEPKQVYCRDCFYSFNWNNRSLEGHLIICDCPHHDHGLLLNAPRVCKYYKKKLNEL